VGLSIESPIGVLYLEGAAALTKLEFALERSPNGGETAFLREAARQLDGYFRGERTAFDLALDPEGTAFEKEVWRALAGIPYGATSTYGAIAHRLGKPNASRAVGAANGRNPIAIVIPCHRVIGADGSLTGYGGGLERKRFLLDLESSQRALFAS
jgi:methylated-DNA-[protein]-cysteine S-methyltransferase